MSGDHSAAMFEEALQLGARPLSELRELACRQRDAAYGRRITYSPKVFIPLTQLCRDVCHYCTFAKTPRSLGSPFMTLDEVVESARRGEAVGCKEALFTLGEKPELRYRAAREWLAEYGFASTVDYLVAACQRVVAETSLIPHVNAGNLTARELRKLRPYMASMGIMLESGADSLIQKGGAHYGSPDKQPWRRWRTIAKAGRQAIPTTTGLLVGIGESRRDRIRDLLAIRRLHLRYGHIQEVIIQNFCAKPDTRMADHPEPSSAEHQWTIAISRLLLPDEVSVQAPPNLSAGTESDLLDSGINDWGGVSPVTKDFVNPEAPWPHLDILKTITATADKLLYPRLSVYGRYLVGQKWLDPEIRRRCLDSSDAMGLLRLESWRAGLSSDLPSISGAPALSTLDPEIARIIARRAADREITEPEISRLFSARDCDAQAIYEAADDLRRRQSGDDVTFVVNRNINYTNVCQYTCHFCAFSKGMPVKSAREMPYDITAEELTRRCLEAWELGATEVCLQGGIHPDYDGNTYLSIVRAVKQAVPELHVHGFSPLELNHGADTLGVALGEYVQRLAAAGLDTVPGTAAEILHDDIRALICPDKLNTREWLTTMEAVHEAGLRSTATIMFGHVETPEHWAAHLAAIRRLQQKTGGFTEFVPLPFVASGSPMYRRGISRPGPTSDETLLMHAVGRVALGDVLPNIQTSWVKLGYRGATRCLGLGANDLGGTLMNESISRAAGASHGQCLDPAMAQQVAADAGRVARQRNTLYGAPDPDQVQRLGQTPLFVTDTRNEPASKRARIKF